MTEPVVSFILVNYRTPAMTIECIHSIREHSKAFPIEIIVADNASGDGSVEQIRAACRETTVIEVERNRGFGAGCNAAAAPARGRYLYLLNTDTLLHEDSAAILVRLLEDKSKAVAVGSGLHFPDGSRQISASYFPHFLSMVAGRDVIAGLLHRIWPKAAKLFMAGPPEEWLDKPLRVGWCVAASLMVAADAYRAVNGFDEDYFMYAEEMDLCLRLSQLGEIWFTPETSVLHLEGGSGGLELNAARLARIAAGHRLYFHKHFSPFQATAILTAWRLSSYCKCVIWHAVAFFTRRPEHRKKAAWHSLFLKNFNTLTYPLPV